MSPLDVAFSHVTTRALRVDRQQRWALEAGSDEQKSMRKYRTGHHRIPLSITHFPQLPAIARIVGAHKSAARADKLESVTCLDSKWGAERKLFARGRVTRCFPP